MTSYLCDGTPEGTLSAIAWILEEGGDAEQVSLSERQDTLFEEGLMLPCDPARAEALYQHLRREAPEAARTLFYVTLAEKEGLETAMLRYIALALRHGDRVNGHLTHPAVSQLVKLSRKAGRELHRMKGLLRFEKLQDGAWLARMEPDHDIIQPLAYHFSRRLRAQDWFIYDVRRHSAARWHRGELRFGTIEQFTAPPLSDEERAVQELWKTFFSSVAIPERRNARLQRSNMPMKYWSYLVEKS